jgi:hypothetical protein
VLSAKHGLVSPDTVIEPYDMKLGRSTRDPRTDAPPIHVWADRVREQLAVELVEVPRVLLVGLAGEQYCTVVRPCQWPFTLPLQGLGLGQRLAWLNNALAELS